MTPEIFYMLKGAFAFIIGFSIGSLFPKLPFWAAVPIVLLSVYLFGIVFDTFAP